MEKIEINYAPKILKKDLRTRGMKKHDVGKLLLGLAMGMTRKSACGYASIPRETFYGWLDRFTEFHTHVVHAEDYWMALVESIKSNQVLSGKPDAIDRELRSRRREVYGTKTSIDLTGGVTMNHELSEEDRALLQEVLTHGKDNE